MRLILTLLLALGLQTFTPQEAQARGGSGYYEKLEYIGPTGVSNNGQPALSLCVLVRTQTALSVDLWRTQKGYALAENNCDVESFIAIDDAKLSALKSAALIPMETPVVPQVKTGLAVPMWAWAVLAVLAVVLGLKTRAKSSRKSERQALVNGASPATLAILDAMCHAAKADGFVSPSELTEIAHAAKAMTGENVAFERVAAMVNLAETNVSPQDFKKFVAGRTQREKEVMMRGVLFVSVADGKLDGKEQQFVGKLASVMKMPGEQIQQLLKEVVAIRSQQATA